MKIFLFFISIFFTLFVGSNNALAQKPIGSKQGSNLTRPPDNDKNTVDKFVRREFTSGQELSIRDELGLGHNFTGLKLKSVTVYASSRFARGKMDLKVNEITVDSAINLSSTSEIVTLYPRQDQVLFGTEVKTLKLFFMGHVKVERIIVVFDKDFNDPYTVEKYIRREFRPEEELSLKDALGIGHNFIGSKIKFITIYASSRFARGSLDLKVNGRVVDSANHISKNITRVDLFPLHNQNILGSNIRTLMLSFRDRIWIERVIITFDADLSNQNSFSKYIRREMRFGEELSLRDELGLGNNFSGRRVRFVTVYAASRFSGGEVNLKVNEYVVNSASVLPNNIQRIVLEPRKWKDVLGSDIRTLKLSFRGTIWVDRVVVDLDPLYSDPWVTTPDEKEFIGDFVYAGHGKTLGVRNILSLGSNYNGRRVDWVVVGFKSDIGARGAVRLIVNGVPFGKVEMIRQGEQYLFLQLDKIYNVLGKDIRTLEVDIKNNSRTERIYIKDLGIKFTMTY